MPRLDDLLEMLTHADDDDDDVDLIIAELTALEMDAVAHGLRHTHHDEMTEFEEMVENHHSGRISRRGNLKGCDMHM